MLAGMAGLCAAQEAATSAAPETDTELPQAAAPWKITGGLVYKNWLYEHDALQQRRPLSAKNAEEWERGDTDGSGTGIQVKIGRGDGWLDLAFTKSGFDYALTPQNAGLPAGAAHRIRTTARDLEAAWWQYRDRNNQAEWGSVVGFRYQGMQKEVDIVENSVTNSGSGNINWLMLEGGYHGNWRPFDTPVFQLRGSLLFFLGEAEGSARSGGDTNWTDRVSETYPEQYSLGYGARASAGMDIGITKRLRLAIDYVREWLYSFDSTDTGIVVFPDNSDALFIENQHALEISLNYEF
jgi:hypothetical protein